jgi:hypothetical protein
MGTRRVVPLLFATLAMVACGEQQQPEGMAGPSLAGGKPVDPAACDPNALNSLITAYFPGSSSTNIKNLKDALIAAGPETDAGLNAGFEILQDIGQLSRKQAVDLAAGSALAQGIIKCTFNAANFTPSFPSDAIYNFAPALNAFAGGAFYTRGTGTGSEDPVQGAIDIDTDNPTVLSGVDALGTATWASVLSRDTVSGARVLIYGYKVSSNPFTYEWATIPPAATFSPGAQVALCDDDAPNQMIQESNIGVLAFQDGSAICSLPYSVVLKETGWGPRALAARLAHVVVDALQPTPVQAAMVTTTKTSGTAGTFKSKFKKVAVDTVTLKFTDKPKSVLKLNQPDTVEVRATTLVNGVITGVNGVCIYLTGTNNNGQNTALGGISDERCAPKDGTVADYTESKNLQAGYASFIFSVNKTGGLAVTATATDDTNSQIGAVGRNGQTFISDQVKTNVKP